MKLNRRSWLLAAPAALPASECVQVGPTLTGIFEILAFDVTGAPIAPVEFQYAPFEPPLRFQLASVGPSRIPYGRYVLNVRAPGFWQTMLVASLSQPVTTVRVTLGVGSCADPQSAALRGTLRGFPSPADLWVKAIPIRGAAGAEARVTPSGYFLLHDLALTEHLLLVLRGSQIIHHQAVTVSTAPYTDVQINLAR